MIAFKTNAQKPIKYKEWNGNAWNHVDQSIIF